MRHGTTVSSINVNMRFRVQYRDAYQAGEWERAKSCIPLTYVDKSYCCQASHPEKNKRDPPPPANLVSLLASLSTFGTLGLWALIRRVKTRSQLRPNMTSPCQRSPWIFSLRNHGHGTYIQTCEAQHRSAWRHMCRISASMVLPVSCKSTSIAHQTSFT